MGALLLHIGLSVLFTWPLVLNFLPDAGTTVPGFMREDRDQNLWNLWWTREALLHGRNPFVTDMIWYPTPISLYFHTLNVFNGILAVPLMTVFSLHTTYNLIVFFSFFMCGWGGFLLFHYLCGNRWAAFVGSLVFAYSAYHIATMRSLLQLVSLEWVPFFLLFFMRAVFDDPWRSTRNVAAWGIKRALPAGIFLFLVSLVDWYYTMYSLILAGMIMLYVGLRYVFRRGQAMPGGATTHVWQPFARAAGCVLVYLALVSPVLVPTIQELSRTSYMRPAADASLIHSADLLTFFQPMRGHKLWGQYFLNRDNWPFGADRYEVYLTYTALALAGIALFKSRRARPLLDPTPVPPASPDATAAEGDARLARASAALPSKWFWAFGVLLFFLLALGPVLQVNGQQVRWLSSPDIPLVMPYRLVENLPVLSISRSPDRFDMPLTLCLGALAGYGTSVLLSWRAWRLPLRRKGALACSAILVLLLVELAPVPYPQLRADIPRWFSVLGQEEGDFSILELPPQNDFWHGAHRMYFQTEHGKRIFGGYISREYPHPFLESTPGYQELTYVDGGGDLFASGPEEWFSAFEQYRTRYIVLYKSRAPHRVDPPVDVSPSRDAIRGVLGAAARPFYEDEQLEVYSVPRPIPRVPFLSVGEGWLPRETGANGTFRWMVSEATLRIDSPSRQEAYLEFKAAGLGPARRLQVFHGDNLVLQTEVGPLQSFRTPGPLGLPEGVSTLSFISVDGTVSPAELGMGTDPRRLGFAVLEARVVPVEK